ncbi:MAG: DUF4911 domain-containing protein [Desulfobacterales bacterium]|nr:DUF4911 domain-containing protein [Desulfobacterales bacterium]MDJ0913924.1 DUF4911 domain-containing protein [Desulfobacterales bacterium]
MNCSRQCWRVERQEIVYIKNIIEAYDGIATLHTLDPKLGLIELAIAPGCEPYVEMILNDFKRDILIEPYSVNKPENAGQTL